MLPITRLVVYLHSRWLMHTFLDLARPKTNHKTAGFTPGERQDFTTTLESLSLVDAFRALNPETPGYTYYSYRFQARQKGLGWRLDYFCVSKALMVEVQSCTVTSLGEDPGGSDHLPLTLILNKI